MAKLLDPVLNTVKSLWGNITGTQRIIIVGLAATMVGIFIAMIFWLNKPEYGLLYANLSAEDANRVVKALETQNVPYVLEQNGTAIMVPAEKVHGLRINIAGENILTGTGVGFEIFNEVQIGATDFVQKLNYRRALEGELARTITEFPSVESARVHLAIPHRSLFIEEQQKPSASVLLKLSDGKKLEKKDVAAIVNLVTMAVEGLDKSKVSIADTTGKVLFEPETEGSVFGMNQTQFEHKNMLQQSLERKIEELLMPVVGAGRIIAKVNADLDFNQKTILRELYDPEKAVVRSEQRSEQTTQGRANIESGVADPNFRGDGPEGAMSTQNSANETRTTNYEINKEEHRIVSNAGEVSRLTVSVVVDGTYEKAEDGTMQFVPRTDEELTRIRQLVAGAVGFDSARGDTIEVSNIPFGTVDLEIDRPLASIIADYALRVGKPLLNGILVFLFLVLVVRPVVLALIRPKVEGRMLEGLEGLPQSEERLALVEDTDESVAATAMLEKIEDIKAHALQLSEQNMDQAIGIIKSWLKKSGSDNKLPAKAA